MAVMTYGSILTYLAYTKTSLVEFDFCAHLKKIEHLNQSHLYESKIAPDSGAPYKGMSYLLHEEVVNEIKRKTLTPRKPQGSA